MPSYINGYIPDRLLITFGSGTNSTDGKWYHKLSAGTLAKHRALVDLAKRKTGRTLQISSGWGAYRPYHIQVLARELYGNGAAFPGTSSHGGFWENQQTLAIDYGNWGSVYNWDREAFFRDVRAVGLEPDMISPRRGYPDEPWHVVDLSPWATPAGSGGSPAGEGSSAALEKEKEDMDFINIQGKAGSHRAGQFAIYRRNSNGALVAKRLTWDTLNPALPTFDDEALTELKKAMPFLDLT